MKRTCLLSCAFVTAALGLSSTASAEPGILYIPTEEVTLRPAEIGVCAGMGGSDNSGLGCVPGLEAEEMRAPYAEAATLTEQVAAALAPYDVLVTNERPPEYVPYLMILPSTEPNPEGLSLTCTPGTGIECGARKRNAIAFTQGATMYCDFGAESAIDEANRVLRATLFAFGHSSGLEGVAPSEDYIDVMEYQQDADNNNYGPLYSEELLTGDGAVYFNDTCVDIVGSRINMEDMVVDATPSCTSADHVGCDAGQQNSAANLMDYYGERTEDAEAPVIEITEPADGATLDRSMPLLMNATVMDSDAIVGARWVISSPALEEAVEGGALSKCTNAVCDSEWDSNLRPPDSDWSFELEGLPAGEYTITFEAADLHGNVAELQTVMVTLEGGGGAGEGESGGGEGESGAEGGGDSFTTTDGVGDDGTDSGDTDTDGATAGAGGDDDSGCGCTSGNDAGGAALFLVGLLGLGWTRRRRG